jgi:Heparinase II/III N-terminus/Heparinase II/III-like protein
MAASYNECPLDVPTFGVRRQSEVATALLPIHSRLLTPQRPPIPFYLRALANACLQPQNQLMRIPFSLSFFCLVIAFPTHLVGAESHRNTEDVRTGNFPFYSYAKQYDIWNFTPLDQGGRQIQLQLIGSERDADIIKAVRSPGFFAPWGNPIRWDVLEKTELEKSVWLNRWYFLPCFARQYYLTHDRSYLDEVFKFIRKWVAENPVPLNLEEYFATKKYNWRDMQVAWRMQNLAWCYFLGKEGYSASEKKELFEIAKTHARVLLEYFGKQPFNENNHQSHGASAMLYAALLFPDIPEAAALKESAFAILNHHLDKAFYDDGNSVELVPGYYPFFASIFRDSFLLCASNHIAPPTRSVERLKQFYNYIGKVVQPNGLMPPINDSTESDPSVLLQVLAEILGQPYPYRSAESHWFSASDQAVMRDTTSPIPAYAFLDAGSRVAAHWHAGKLGFQLWFWDKAFVIDSGICDYDDKLRRGWFNKAEAHNTILVDGKGDYDWTQFNETTRSNAGSRILQWESNDKYDWAVMQHSGFQDRQAPVSWVRHFLLLKGFGALIVDQLDSESAHEYTWLFHLLPCSPDVDKKSKSVHTGLPDLSLLILPAESEMLTGPKLSDGVMNRRGTNVSNPVAKYEVHGAKVQQAYFLLPGKGGEQAVLQFRQMVDGESFGCELSGGFGRKRLKFARAEQGRRKYSLNLSITSTGETPDRRERN